MHYAHNFQGRRACQTRNRPKRAAALAMMLGLTLCTEAAEAAKFGFFLRPELRLSCRSSTDAEQYTGYDGTLYARKTCSEMICTELAFGEAPARQTRYGGCTVQTGVHAAMKRLQQPADGNTLPSDKAETLKSTDGSYLWRKAGPEECVAGAVIRNAVLDCGGKTLGMGCKSNNETQPAVLTLENAWVKNVRLAYDGGADGIHCDKGDCVLQNVVWENICEDAATNKSEGGAMIIIGGSAYNNYNTPGGEKPDKIFQHNSKNSVTVVTGGFKAKGVNDKLWRSCGNCQDNGGPRYLIADDVVTDETYATGAAQLNRNYGDVAVIRNFRVKNYVPGKPKICLESEGIQKGKETLGKASEVFDSAHCLVRNEDIIPF